MSDRLATLAFIVLALMLLALMAAQAQRLEGGYVVDHSFRTTTRPMWEGVLGIARSMQRIWENYLYVVGARREREQMLARVNKLEAEHQKTREVWLENQRLRQMLALREDDGFQQGVVGRVIADLSSGPLRRAVLIDRGTRDGIGRNWVVISRGALVGQVRDADSNSSEVMLVDDPDSGVGVRHQLDRFAGILRGGNRGPAMLSRLEYVPRDQAVAVGDAIVTSGLDGIFPPGLLVGHVRDMAAESQLTWRIAVELAADMSHLEEVLIIAPSHRPPTRLTAPRPEETAPPPPAGRTP
jgi:rod shape-determining protein MreC